MTLAAGSVAIDSSGGETTVTGIILDIYTAFKATLVAALAAFSQVLPGPGAALSALLKGQATLATNIGTAVYTALTTKANPQIIVPANAFGAGIPAAPVTIGGTPATSSIL